VALPFSHATIVYPWNTWFVLVPKPASISGYSLENDDPYLLARIQVALELSKKGWKPVVHASRCPILPLLPSSNNLHITDANFASWNVCHDVDTERSRFLPLDASFGLPCH
jgi:hypothetical protein